MTTTEKAFRVGCGIIFILIVVAIVAPIFYRHKTPPRTQCRANMQRAYVILAAWAYRENGGKLPTNEYDPVEGCPQWIAVLRKHFDSKDRTAFERTLKCPEDKSGSLSSYELVRPGCRLKDIPEYKLRTTVVFRERAFKGSHGLFLTASGSAYASSEIPDLDIWK